MFLPEPNSKRFISKSVDIHRVYKSVEPPIYVGDFQTFVFSITSLGDRKIP